MNWSRDIDKYGVGYCCGGDTFAINRQYSFPVTITKGPSRQEKTQARIDHLWKKWEEA
jgi:hypothetical protein